MNTEGRRARNLSTAVVAAIATLASASARSEQWQWSVTPYLWATDLGVDLTISDRELVDADIPFEDLLDKLDGATLVRVEGMHGEHGMAFDLFNVELTDSVGIELPGPSGTELAVDTEIGMTILDVTGVYDPHGDREGFSLVYGARILEQRNDVDAALRHDATTIGTRSLDATDRLVDGLVGFRYVRALPHNLSYELAADVSTGDTELTWSAGPTLGYTFGARDRYQVTAGYRRMVVDFDTAEHVDADMSMSGILVGFRIDF
jgi:hypothetical protein